MIFGRFSQEFSNCLKFFVFRLILKSFLDDIAVDVVESALTCNHKAVEDHDQNDQYNKQIRG